MNILVIRHGQSEADILGVHEGRADFPLTEEGKAQAVKMAEWVAGRYRIDRIYSSTLIRARDTAEFLSEKTRTPILLREELMEFDNGLLAGLTFEEADEKYPKIDGLPIHDSVYQMETMLNFRFRAERILSEILEENDLESTIALISHGGMIAQLYRAFLQLPVCSCVHFATGDTGIHFWKTDSADRRILFSNSMAHLCDSI